MENLAAYKNREGEHPIGVSVVTRWEEQKPPYTTQNAVVWVEQFIYLSISNLYDLAQGELGLICKTEERGQSFDHSFLHVSHNRLLL